MRGHHPSGNRRHWHPSKGTVIWKLRKSLYVLRSAPRRWQDHLEDIISKCVFLSQICSTTDCGVTRPSGCHWCVPRRRFVVGWSAPDCHRNPFRAETRLGTQEQRGDDETNALPGSHPTKKIGTATPRVSTNTNTPHYHKGRSSGPNGCVSDEFERLEN